MILDPTFRPNRPWEPYLRALPHSHEPYYHFLYWLSKSMDPASLFLVLGAYRATCCAHIAMGNPKVMVAGFDLTITPEARAIEKDFQNVLLFQESSLSAAVHDVILHSGHRLQAIFFDTSHNYAQVKAELLHLRPYITPNVIMVFDDVHAAEDEVLRAIQEFGVIYTPMDHLHTTLGFGVATSLV